MGTHDLGMCFGVSPCFESPKHLLDGRRSSCHEQESVRPCRRARAGARRAGGRTGGAEPRAQGVPAPGQGEQGPQHGPAPAPTVASTRAANQVRFLVTDASNQRVGGEVRSQLLAEARQRGRHRRDRAASPGRTRGPVFPFTPNFAQDQVVIPGAPGRTDCPAGTVALAGRRRPAGATARGRPPTARSAQGLGERQRLQQLHAADRDPDAGRSGRAQRAAHRELHGPAGPGRQVGGQKGPVGHVIFVLTAGLHNGRTVHYITTESSIAILAALEATTFAPRSTAAPSTATNDDHRGDGTLWDRVDHQRPDRTGQPRAPGDHLGDLRRRRVAAEHHPVHAG